MAGEAEVRFTGNLIADPELRFTASGHAVAGFVVAVNSRVKQGDTWTDGTATLYRCSACRGLVVNLAASAHKGDAVTVTGTTEAKSYDKDGESRLAWAVRATDVALSLAL